MFEQETRSIKIYSFRSILLSACLKAYRFSEASVAIILGSKLIWPPRRTIRRDAIRCCYEYVIFVAILGAQPFAIACAIEIYK